MSAVPYLSMSSLQRYLYIQYEVHGLVTELLHWSTAGQPGLSGKAWMMIILCLHDYQFSVQSGVSAKAMYVDAHSDW